MPFVLGMAAALSAVALYGMFVPGPRALTQQDVASGISRALASMTPAPPLSLRAYKAVQPSLVLIVTQVATSLEEAHGLGMLH